MRNNEARATPGSADVVPTTANIKDPTATTTSVPGLTPEQSRILHNWIADANGVPAERLAYVAVVVIAEGKYRRRPYLTLAAAQRAVELAEARGVAASVTLCELLPVHGSTFWPDGQKVDEVQR